MQCGVFFTPSCKNATTYPPPPPPGGAYRLAMYAQVQKLENPQCKPQTPNPATHSVSVHGASQSPTIMILRMVQSGHYPVGFGVEPLPFPAVQAAEALD